jgi:hypothetical protein
MPALWPKAATLGFRFSVLQVFTPPPPRSVGRESCPQSVSGSVRCSVTEIRLKSATCQVRWANRPQPSSEEVRFRSALGIWPRRNSGNSSSYSIRGLRVPLPHNPFVRGSSPRGPTIFCRFHRVMIWSDGIWSFIVRWPWLWNSKFLSTLPSASSEWPLTYPRPFVQPIGLRYHDDWD